MYIEGDVPSVVTSNGNGNGNGGFGDWSWIVGLAIIGALFGGFGNGFGGNRGGGDFAGWQLGRLATTNDVASGFSTSEIMSDLNSIILGQSQMQNFINQGFSGVNTSLLQGKLKETTQMGAEFDSFGSDYDEFASVVVEPGESIADACAVHGTDADELVKKINEYFAAK